MARLVAATVGVIGGIAIFVFGSGYFSLFPTNGDPRYLAALATIFLLTVMVPRRSRVTTAYWRAAFPFFVATAALLCSTLLAGSAGSVLSLWGLTTRSSAGIAVAKAYETAVVVLPILVLTRLAGEPLGSIYLQRGRVRPALLIGGLVFVNFAASAFLFFAARYSAAALLGSAAVWGLLFALANGFLEELWMRGIFLRAWERMLGPFGAVALTSVVFSLAHVGAVYLTPQAIPFMLANTLTLGIACGVLILRTDCLWGAVLVHAASDYVLFLALLANA